MTMVAVVVVVAVVGVSVWAWRSAPGKQAADEFLRIWQGGRWGKQLIVDFFGLEAVLALWMLTDAAAHGTWILAIGCIVTMPVFGSMAAATYWLLRG